MIPQRKDVIFYNEPRKFTVKDYDNEIDRVVDVLSECDDVVSIYQIGEVSCPGISDLDFIVVVRDKMKNSGDYKKRISALWKNNFLMMHPPYAFNRNLAPKIPYAISLFNLIRLYGEDVRLQKSENISLLDLAILIDLISFYWPREFLDLLTKKKHYAKNLYLRVLMTDILPCKSKYVIDTRNVLCRLNSMQYPLALYNRLTGKNIPKLEIPVKKAISLRNNWFKLDENRYDQLLLIIHEMINGIADLIAGVSDLVSKEKIVTQNLEPFCFKNFQGEIRFGAGGEEGELITKGILPNNLSINLRRFLGEKILLKDNYSHVLDERHNVLKNHIKFLNDNQIYYGEIFYYTYPFKGPLLYTIYFKLLRWLS